MDRAELFASLEILAGPFQDSPSFTIDDLHIGNEAGSSRVTLVVVYVLQGVIGELKRPRSNIHLKAETCRKASCLPLFEKIKKTKKQELQEIPNEVWRSSSTDQPRLHNAKTGTIHLGCPSPDLEDQCVPALILHEIAIAANTFQWAMTNAQLVVSAIDRDAVP